MSVSHSSGMTLMNFRSFLSRWPFQIWTLILPRQSVFSFAPAIIVRCAATRSSVLVIWQDDLDFSMSKLLNRSLNPPFNMRMIMCEGAQNLQQMRFINFFTGISKATFTDLHPQLEVAYLVAATRAWVFRPVCEQEPFGSSSFLTDYIDIGILRTPDTTRKNLRLHGIL